MALLTMLKEIITLTNEQSGGIGVLNVDSDLAPYIGNISDKQMIIHIQQFFELLNVPLRNGYEPPYITFNLGVDVSENAKKVSKCFLIALRNGELLTSNPYLFPNIVFKVKEGINQSVNDSNYDLFLEAVKTSSIRMNPTYFNCDSLLVNNLNERKIGIMGCRTLLTDNIYGESGALHRGNITSVSLNLPAIAHKSLNYPDFIKNLHDEANNVKSILLTKYQALCNLDVNNFNHIKNNKLYMYDGNNTKDIFKNGSLSLGFIGLFDCISKLKKQEITKDFITENISLGHEILKSLRDLTDKWTNEESLNFSLLATPAEGLSGKFASNDVTNDFYTNSFHIPVYLEFNVFEKLDIEANFATYCNGGSISYVEFPHAMNKNFDAIEDTIKYGLNKDITYLGINFPLDYCNKCNFTSSFNQDVCPNCNSDDISKIRRVSGYLSYQKDLKRGKKEEEEKRISHFN